jgi:hypothetical protein
MVWQRLRVFATFGLAIGLLLAAEGFTGACRAGMISYGDFGPVPPGVMFVDVIESSGTDPVPLFGIPDPFSVGLDFDPTSFVATANGGAADVTDGQLNFLVMGSVNLPDFVGISTISLFEAGDYTLAGTGTASTQAIAGANILATVTQINGVNVAPINLVPASGSVTFDLAANPGIVQPWSLDLMIDVAAQLGPNQKATKVEIAIDNQLLALSETGSLSFIAKKDFRITVEPEGEIPIPEPNSLMLVLSSCVFWAATRRCKYSLAAC